MTRMTKKSVLMAAFGIILAVGLASNLSAGETGFAIAPAALPLSGHSYLNFDLSLFASGDEWVFRDYSTGRRLGASFLNVFLGLGSFTMGDWDGGAGILMRQGVGLGMTALGLWLAYASFNWLHSMDGLLVVATILGAPILAITGISVGIGAAVMGVSYYVSGLIYGFRRPFVYQRPAKTARLDDIRNWDVALVADTNGRHGGQITFTAHF